MHVVTVPPSRGSWRRRPPRWTCSATGGSSSAWASAPRRASSACSASRPTPGTTANFDIAVWGTLDTDGQLAGVLPDYAAAGATWFIESPTSSRPGWLDAVRDRISRGPEVQSPRG